MNKAFSTGLVALLFVTLAGCATGAGGGYPSASPSGRRGDEYSRSPVERGAERYPSGLSVYQTP